MPARKPRKTRRSTKKVKVGVFGARRGLSMMHTVARHPDAELVAVCDKDKDILALRRCDPVLKASGVRFYSDFEKFFQHDMDAVVLANYAHEHAPFAVRLLDSGRHVTSEVLACGTMGEAVELVEAVERNPKLVYAYAENYCYMHTTSEMRRRYRAGDIGEFRHGEGEYVHDTHGSAASLTRGEPWHWRTWMSSTFYCTHSIGPVITITGTRPVRVVAFETPQTRGPSIVRRAGTSGMICCQMSNGATLKSLQGQLRREPSSVWYCVYGTEGMMETGRWADGRVYVHRRSSDAPTKYEIGYWPKPVDISSASRRTAGHGGGDFYTIAYFIEAILGRSRAPAIDVYTALDMTMPGLLGYRSIVEGNVPIEVPDMRRKRVREKYRGDNWSLDPKYAGPGQPRLHCSHGEKPIAKAAGTEARRGYRRWLAEERKALGLD